MEGKEKRGPGRPCKKIARADLPKSGIVNSASIGEPEDSRMAYSIEVLYDNPMMFKKIFQFIKSMGSQEVRIKFHESGIKIYATGHDKNSNIFVQIDGSRMNRYYCVAAYEIGIKTEVILQVLGTISKNYLTLCLYSREMEKISKLHVVLNNGMLELEHDYEIDLSVPADMDDDDIEDCIAQEESYPIKFKIDFKEYKKIVTDACCVAERIMFSKNGAAGSLTLDYQFRDNTGRDCAIFRNPDKIDLVSTVGADENFTMSMNITNLKPLAASTVSNFVRLSIDERRKTIFTVNLDEEYDSKKKPKDGTEVCTIYVVTKTLATV